MNAIQQMTEKKIGTTVPPGKRAITPGWRYFLTLTGLGALACATYWSVMNNGPVADDWGQLSRVFDLPSSGLWRLFAAQSPHSIRPIPFFSVWLLYRPFGLNFMPSHLLSVGLHAINAFLLIWLLAELGVRFRTGVVAALLFLVTPLSAQAVSWVAGRYEVWTLFFMLLALALYAAFLRRGKRWRYALAMLATIAAWLCKEPAMTMIGLIPALEIIFLFLPPAATRVKDWRQRFRAALKPAAIRVGILYVLFVGYITMRYVIMGRFGGAPYVPLFGKPSLGAMIQTTKTLLAPLDALQSSRGMTMLLTVYVGVLYAVSLGLIVLRWKRASLRARRAWLFMAAFFAASLVPIYAYVFIPGWAGGLGYSRMFYGPYAAFISLMAIGLLEFGWRSPLWQVGVLVVLLALVPIFIIGLNRNNRVWENQAVVSSAIAAQIPAELPDPPQGAKLYFRNVPRLIGSHIFGSAMLETVDVVYRRRDLQAFYVNPDPNPWLRNFFPDSVAKDSDGYLFNFDWSTYRLSLVRGPLIRAKPEKNPPQPYPPSVVP